MKFNQLAELGIPSMAMSNLIQNVVDNHEQNNLREFTNFLHQCQKRYLLRSDILIAFYKYCGINDSDKDLYRNSHLGKLIYFTQEIILDQESVYLVIGPQIAIQEAYRLQSDMTVESISMDEFLKLRDKMVNCNYSLDGEVLKIDFQPFYEYSPNVGDSKKIGHGVDYLNRYLSSKLFDEHCGSLGEALFNFLSQYKYNGQQLLINERIKNTSQLSSKVKRVVNLLETYPPQTSYENFRFELRSFGFEPGWGNTAYRTRETLLMLDQLLDCADHQVLSKFIERIPMVFKILLTSPHGWFGQEDVLGRPDSGQVVYILHQVKELEKQIQENSKLAGLDVLGVVEPKIIVLTPLIPNSESTNCNQRLEKIDGSNNCWILRVPQHESQGSITENWISGFYLETYLETFATQEQGEFLAELQPQSDLITPFSV